MHGNKKELNDHGKKKKIDPKCFFLKYLLYNSKIKLKIEDLRLDN